MNSTLRRLGAAVCLAALGSPALAAEPDQKPGADSASDEAEAVDAPGRLDLFERPLRSFLERRIHEEITFKGGFTGVAQDSSDGSVDGDLEASIDLLLRGPLGDGHWTLYLEGSSSPWERRVNERVPEANADVGSALESDGDARVQISGLFYRHPVPGWPGANVSIGLLDASAFLDSSRVANDETTQFLANPLVNDPVILFPDYTLGAAWKAPPGESLPGLTLLLARSHGMGDDDPSYSSLFDDDVPDVDGDGRGDDKGWFGAVELEFDLGEGSAAKLGAWGSTGDRPRLGGTGATDESRGVYGVLDGALSESHDALAGMLWAVRAGWADEDLSPGEAFLSAAVELPTTTAAFGLGAAHTFASDQLGSGRADTTVLEAYARFDVMDGVQVTPSVQFVGNSGLTDADPTRDDSIFIFGLRVQISF